MSGAAFESGLSAFSAPMDLKMFQIINLNKGPFTQAIFVAATQCNSMQFLSRRSCKQLRFHCDFSEICQC